MANNKIAVVSKTPGRTRLANFYDFGKYRLIDLPGYGFAQSDAKTGKDIIHIVNKYIAERKNLFGVFQLVDSGVITKEDLEVSQEIREKFANYIILANKIDKLSKNELFNKQNEIAKKFNINVENVVLVSAKTKTNINLIFSAISK
jgi:GTP-binding protein